MNSFVDFWTKKIFLNFKSSHNCVDFHTCNLDFFSIKNWKVLKTWRLNKIDLSFKINWFMTSFILVSSLIANSALTIESATFFMFVSSPLLISFALSMPNSTATPLPVLDSVAAPLLEPDSVPVPAPKLLSVSSAELDSGSSTFESHASSLLISTYCQAHVLNKSRSL